MVVERDRSEIAFFDVETTVPTRSGQGFSILEFGTILVCPRKLEELESYSTLVRPSNLSLLNSLSVRCSGITRDAIQFAPTFRDISGQVYDLLHGRIWAGHNILRFDCHRVQEAFDEIGQPSPRPKGTVDTLVLLTKKFGRRAGDMKMASLASYFKIGQQVHRSLDDCRMNLEVVKYCATVLFLESSLPDIFTESSWVSPNATTRSRSNRNSSAESFQITKKDSHLQCLCDGKESARLSSGEPSASLAETLDSAMYMDLGDVCTSSIGASFTPNNGSHCRIRIMYMGGPFRISCTHLRVRFGVDSKSFDRSGHAPLSFLVDVTPGLSRVLDKCDDVARRLSMVSGFEWRPSVMKKNGFANSPAVRLNLPLLANGDGLVEIFKREEDGSIGLVEIFKREEDGSMQKIPKAGLDVREMTSVLRPGVTMDAFLWVDTITHCKYSGTRLTLHKLFLHSNTC